MNKGMLRTKKAEAGIGTLILFIAMILVAAVAAGVLIQTANSLQGKALATGSQAKDQVTTGVQFLNIYGEDASADNDLEDYYIEAKLIPGSDLIKLDDAVLEFTLNNDSASLNFGNITDCGTAVLNSTHYNVEYLLNGTNHLDNYLVSGDVMLVCFSGVRDVAEDESINFIFIPRTGVLTKAEVTTPSVMTENTVYLFP